MQVRQLKGHLADRSLISRCQLDALKGLRLGIDALYWLRSLPALKDPFAAALGGVPPGICSVVDKELSSYCNNGILPVFVFQGMTPTFITRTNHRGTSDQQMDHAWIYLAHGQKSEAQKCFAASISRINGDIEYLIFHHLKHRGCEVIRAPYFAGAQLMHFLEQGIVHAVFGSSSLLLYNIPRVIVEIDFGHQTLDWVDMEAVLDNWQINKDQFISACMLAGTEYCLTYPYLSLGHVPNAANIHGMHRYAQHPNGKANFDTAVQMLKQAPLLSWMEAFPTEEMKNAHIDGYCTCKVLIRSTPILHTTDNTVRPMGSGLAGAAPNQVPCDFKVIVGEQLPDSLYYLLLNGVVSNKLPQALARGEWVDKSHPLVCTRELHDLLTDLTDYRQRALGLIAQHLPEGFGKKNIVCRTAWEQHDGQQSSAAQPRVIQPRKLGRGLRWHIHAEAVAAEMRRQGVAKVDFKFCLQWHAHEVHTDGQLYMDLRRIGEYAYSNDTNALSALVHFMTLEQMELIAEDGEMTVLGSVLQDCPRNLQEPCLAALEMMKFGILNGEPFEAAQPDRPFPEPVQYPRAPIDEWTKSTLLLSRAMSLVPMRLKNRMWNSDVDFDLAAFHSLVRMLKRSLRQLSEASLASILLRDLSRVKLLPPGFMCSTPESADHTQTPALLPTFMLPCACMGIVCLYFLRYDSDPGTFSKKLAFSFPCCVQPKEDLRIAIIFWQELRRCVATIAEPLGAEELAADMEVANNVLCQQQQRLGFFPHRGNRFSGSQTEGAASTAFKFHPAPLW